MSKDKYRGYDANNLLWKLMTNQIDEDYKLYYNLTVLLIQEHDKESIDKIKVLIFSTDKECRDLGLSLLFSYHLRLFNWCLEHRKKIIEQVDYCFRFIMFTGDYGDWFR